MRSAGRRAAIYVATLAVASALTGVFAAPAGAEEPAPTPTSTAPSTAPSKPELPSSSAEPAPSAPSSSEASKQPAAKAAQIAVSVAFDKPSYKTDEEVRFTFKVTNTGSARAAGLTVFQRTDEPTDLAILYDGWGAYKGKPGLSLEPGETSELAVSGHVRDVEQTTAAVRGIVFDETGFGVGSFASSVPITKVPGRAVGVVYGDKNGNGVLDAGEQLAGAKLTLRYVHGSGTYTATSDADGKFSFDVSAGEYTLGGEVVDGWLIPWDTLRIGPDTGDLLVRGVPPLNGALKASLAFTQNSYQPGDLAHLTVTLSNSGSIPLAGIVAACNRIGDSHLLNATGPGWGDLVWDRGVTIDAGQTRTFDVSEAVPQASFNRGKVVAACDFGYSEVDIENHAEARAEAAVPGAKAIVEGSIGDVDDQGQVTKGLAGAKVVLVSDRHCPVTGERTTDANGHFKFEDVAPGPEYRLYFLLPDGWKTKYDNPMSIEVQGPPENHYSYRIDVEEGNAPLPAVPTNPADCGDAGSPTSTTGAAAGGGGESGGGSGLASTGVDALGLGALALVALALGGGLVIGARRRRHSA